MRCLWSDDSNLKLAILWPGPTTPIECYACHSKIGDYDLVNFSSDHLSRSFMKKYKYPFYIDKKHHRQSDLIIFIHNNCKKKYFNSFFCGVEMKGDEKCSICESPLKGSENKFTAKLNRKLLEEHKIPGYKLTHIGCNPEICPYCQNPIGMQNCVDIGEYVIHSSCNNFLVKWFPQHVDPYDLNSRSKKIVWQVDVKVFWPQVCNRQTFSMFPREFRVMAREFIMVMRRLYKRTTVPMDIILKILTAAIQPIEYQYQNGMDMTKVHTTTRLKEHSLCLLCGQKIGLCHLDHDYCATYACRTYLGRCPKSHLIKYNSNPYTWCTGYRCMTEKCTLCDGPIRPYKIEYDNGAGHNPPSEPIMCDKNSCSLYIRRCECGRWIYRDGELPNKEDMERRDADPRRCIDKLCSYRIYKVVGYRVERFCTCGAPMYDQPINDKYCSPAKCRYGDEKQSIFIKETMDKVAANEIKERAEMRAFGISHFN